MTELTLTLRQSGVLAALLCSLALAFAALGETHTQSSKHSSGRESAASGGAHVQHAQAPQPRPANVEHPTQTNTEVHTQAPSQHAASPGHPVGVPSGGNPASRLTEPENHPETAPAGNAAAKPAAPAPPAPFYHYNFPTISGLIVRDFTTPLTTE